MPVLHPQLSRQCCCCRCRLQSLLVLRACLSAGCGLAAVHWWHGQHGQHRCHCCWHLAAACWPSCWGLPMRLSPRSEPPWQAAQSLLRHECCSAHQQPGHRLQAQQRPAQRKSARSANPGRIPFALWPCHRAPAQEAWPGQVRCASYRHACGHPRAQGATSQATQNTHLALQLLRCRCWCAEPRGAAEHRRCWQ